MMEKIIQNWDSLLSVKETFSCNMKSATRNRTWPVALLLISFLLPMKSWASVPYHAAEEYKFGEYAQAGGSIDFSTLIMSASGKSNVDLSRFSFNKTEKISMSTESGTRYGLWLGLSAGSAETSQTSMTIKNLRAGDIVTIQLSESGLMCFETSTAKCVLRDQHQCLPTIYNETNVLDITKDGDLVLKPNGSRCYIQLITIQSIKDATYTLTTTQNNSGYSSYFEFTGGGRMQNTVAVPFLAVSFGSSLNGAIVDNDITMGYASHIFDWNHYTSIWFDLDPDAFDSNGNSFNVPYQGTFYKFVPTANGQLTVKGHTNKGWGVDDNYFGIFKYHTKDHYMQPIWYYNGGADTDIEFTVNLEKDCIYYIGDNGAAGNQSNMRSYNTFRLHSFSFVNTFHMPLAKVTQHKATGDDNLATVLGADRLVNWSIKRVSDNIDTDHIQVSYNASTQKLGISGIGYLSDDKDHAGTIILDLEFNSGYATFVVTIPYNAEYNEGNGHTWNFYDKVLEIGQNKNTSSQLHQGVENNEWTYSQRVTGEAGGFHDPMYLNVSNMVGNNADMIWETEGLWFDNPSLKSCLYNENDVNTNAYTDRYVGLLPVANGSSSFTIPSLKAGDRVAIRMAGGEATDANTCYFNITNAKDAMGYAISSTDQYHPGGSVWNTGRNDLMGYYHFQAIADGDMTFKMVGGSVAKIYSIQIYHFADETKLSTVDMTTVKMKSDGTWPSEATYNNKDYKGSSYLFLNSYKSSQPASSCYHLHYRGKGERIGADKLMVLKQTGSITKSPFVGSDNYTVYYESNIGDFGTLRMRVPCMELSGKYVADYADQNLSVGYVEKNDSPYTWDFTDLQSYANTDDGLKSDLDPENEYGKYFINLWNNEYGMNVRNNTTGYGGEVVYAGGQLYADKNMFPESKGTSFFRDSYGNDANGSLKLIDGGVQIDKNWYITIPEVPANAAVYVRASEAEFAGYRMTDVADDYDFSAVGAETDYTDFTYVGSAGDDNIYAVLNSTRASKVITLGFRGTTVKKIAVSTDFKTVNDLGYASESRDHEIDPELMGYMTGTGLKAYTVTNVNYGDKAGDVPSITLEAVDKAYVIDAANTGDHNAYIIYNTDAAKEGSKAVKAINNGFHLFVPDMHDKSVANDKKSKLDVSGNSLKSWLTGGKVPQTEGAYTNYLMNSKGYNEITGEVVEGEEAFYRASSNNSLGANKAYLQLLTEKVKPNNGKPVTAKMAIVFVDEESGTQTTSIDGVDSREDILGNNDYYTLSGVKVNAPAKGGIYIKNGKKVIVK